MQIGWREFIKRRFRKSSKFHSVGIEFGSNDVHLSTLKKVKGQLTWVKQHSISIDSWQSDLKSYVEQNGLESTVCHVVLSISKYQLLQLDRPAVEDAELLQALQWSVKEQLSSEDELAIDYFDPPAPSNNKKVNVVAVPKTEIITLRDGILKAGLNLDCIGVEELATCNLLPFSDDSMIVLKQESGGQLSLSIIKQGKSYFSRRLRGYENLASFSPEELKMGVVDNLSLEIQRSTDYFESQLRQAPVKKVYISLDTSHQEELAEQIKQVLFIDVEKFDVSIPRSDAIPLTPSSFSSLGAAINTAGLVA